MDLAVARVITARAALALDSASAVSLAYYAEINGLFDPQHASAAAAVQKQREAADYEAVRPSEHEAAAAVQTAERFVAAVQAMLANG